MEDSARLMMARLGLWGLAVFLVARGGHGLYTAFTNRTPQSITCAEAEKTLPAGAWLKLTGCRVNLMNASVRTKSDGMPTGEVVVPLTAAGPNAPKTTRIVLVTRDAEIAAVLSQMRALGADESRLAAFVRGSRDRIVRDKEVTGLVQSGFDRKRTIEDHMRRANKNLSGDLLFIDEGREPEWLVSALMLAGSVVLVILLRTVLKAE